MVVGADVLGGFFLLDGGAMGEPGVVFHLEADSLNLVSMGGSYSDWLLWCLGSDLDEYYGPLRWAGWRGEVEAVAWERGISVYPPPYTVEGRDPGQGRRAAVPLGELWGMAWDTRRQLGL